MKNKKTPFYIGLGLIALAVLLLLFWNNSAQQPEYNWSENYRENSTQPYGTYVIYETLKEHFPNETFTTINNNFEDVLFENFDGPANYIFIGEGLYLDTANRDMILRFVAQGNNAFISAKSFPFELMDEDLYTYSLACDYAYWEGPETFRDTSAKLSLNNVNLNTKKTTPFGFYRYNKPAFYRWHYLPEVYFCEEKTDFIPIGRINNEFVNFVQVPYGKGYFYLHLTPLAFTNYHMITEAGLDYAKRTLSYLNEGPIIWDAYNHVGEFNDQNNNQDFSEPVTLSDKSPLQYILSQKSLRWAWYLLLVAALLYLIFRAKRRQKPIPILEQNTNTSLEFIETIGRLYFQQNDHKKLIAQKMRLFLAHIRERYHLPTHIIDESLIDKLVKVSGLEEKEVKTIFAQFNNLKSIPNVSESQLIEFHLALDNFYKNCK